MSIIDNIKDKARKATNIVVDTAENMMNKPKTPKEMAKRLVEHLSHQEYTKIAEILSDEAKKYADHMGIDNFPLVETKLDDFKGAMEELAGNMEAGDYKHVAEKLTVIEESIPESMAGMTEVFVSLKSLLKSIIEIMKDYSDGRTPGGGDAKPNFSKLQEVFESYFMKMTRK